MAKAGGQERTGRAVIASMRRLIGTRVLTVPWWLLVFAVCAGTNLLDFFLLPLGRSSSVAIVAAVLRVLLVFWISYALVRRMAGLERPAQLTAGYVPFLIVSLLFAIPAAGIMVALTPWTMHMGAGLKAITLFLAQLVTGLILLRLLAWQQSLAIGDRLGLAQGWHALRGAWGGLAIGLLCILPVAAVHLAMTLAALLSGRTGKVVIALVDGAVSSLQLALTSALGVTAWLIAREKR